jgi:hypothetical protein
VEEKEMENFEPQNFVPLVETEEFLGEVAVAEIAEDQAEESFEVLLGETNVDAIVARVAAPSHTRVDFSKSESAEDSESFDASENILDDIATPEIPTYVPTPVTVYAKGYRPPTVDHPVTIYAKGYRPPVKRLRAPDGIHVGEGTAKTVVSQDGRFVSEYDAEGEPLREYEMVEVED